MESGIISSDHLSQWRNLPALFSSSFFLCHAILLQVTSCVLRGTDYKKGLFPINNSQPVTRNPIDSKSTVIRWKKSEKYCLWFIARLFFFLASVIPWLKATWHLKVALQLPAWISRFIFLQHFICKSEQSRKKRMRMHQMLILKIKPDPYHKIKKVIQ